MILNVDGYGGLQKEIITRDNVQSVIESCMADYIYEKFKLYMNEYEEMIRDLAMQKYPERFL